MYENIHIFKDTFEARYKIIFEDTFESSLSKIIFKGNFEAGN
jgi:hypothetical protein